MYPYMHKTVTTDTVTTSSGTSVIMKYKPSNITVVTKFGVNENLESWFPRLYDELNDLVDAQIENSVVNMKPLNGSLVRSVTMDTNNHNFIV